MLTMSAVREHIKCEAGEDAVLAVYISAAVQAAERYSKRRLKPGSVTDQYPNPVGRTFKLSAQPSGPVVARLVADKTSTVIAHVVGTTAMLPFDVDCANVHMVELLYPTGATADDAPGDMLVDTEPMIELGILQFVAYAYEHRGDDPNSWAADSGAARLWRSFRPINFG